MPGRASLVLVLHVLFSGQLLERSTHRLGNEKGGQESKEGKCSKAIAND